MAVIVGHDLFNDIAREHFLPVDDAGDFNDFRGLPIEFLLQSKSFRAAGQIAKHRFVYWGRWAWNVVHHASGVGKTPFEYHAV
jgi:hypothetical protein